MATARVVPRFLSPKKKITIERRVLAWVEQNYKCLIIKL